MSKLQSGPTFISSTDIFHESSVQSEALGQRGQTADGRIFRYGKAGEAITLGYLAVAPSIDTATITMAVTSAAAIGDTSITFTHGATTSTADEYKEGYATISYGTGIGQTLKVKSHLAYTSGQTSAVVNLEDPIIVALDTTSKLDLAHNQYSGVQMTTGATLPPAGVPVRSMTSAYFGWYQTRGVVGLFSDATIAAGYEFMNDASVSGAIDVTGTDAQVIKVGHAIQAGAQNYAHQVFLMID